MTRYEFDEWDDLPATTMSAKAALVCIGMVAAALCTILCAGSKEVREIAKKEQQQKEAQHGR